ncbi:MAG: PHP domain-containing protein, partial [Erysipelotrichaceae bacterium]|nr:PHP domain-containing protein [Erysipelotrichaceae bacterium]
MSCPLYIRSVYSLLSSMCSIEGIVSYARKYGFDHVGLVDRNVLAGAMAFKKACEKAGITPAYGLEFDVQIQSRIFTCIMYAKDDEGFKNLMALSSHICTKQIEAIDPETLNEYKDHNVLCLLSDSMPLTYVIDRKEDVDDMLMKQKMWFGNYIVALVDHDI